jgi:hypothetical protein
MPGGSRFARLAGGVPKGFFFRVTASSFLNQGGDFARGFCTRQAVEIQSIGQHNGNSVTH